MKQPTNCSRLSRKRRRRRGPFPLSLAALLLCVVVWLFCSGGMWTIAHPSSAGPSWRPSIKDEETTRTSKSPIHFCLCRDIYHGDVIEISIHPVCVPCPPPPSVCLSFSSRKMTTPVENRYVEMGEAPEIIRWEPKKKKISFWQKKLLTKPGTIPVFLLFTQPSRPPLLIFVLWTWLLLLDCTRKFGLFRSD